MLKETKKLIFLLLAIAITLTTTVKSTTNSNIVVLWKGKIFIDENKFEEAVAIYQGKIVFVGSSIEAEKYAGSDAKYVDLKGKLVLPGLHDVHMHPLEAYNGSEYDDACSFNTEEENMEVLVKILIDCKPKANSNGWINGRGHDLSMLLAYINEIEILPRELLDRVSTTIPICVLEATSHSIWVNSKALEVMKITKDTKQPIGGYILKDSKGVPNGILLDNAGDIIIQESLKDNETLYKNNYGGLVIGIKEMNQYGLTSIVEGRTYWKRRYIEIWKELKKNNLLTMRVTLTPWLYPGDEDTEQIAKLTSFYEKNDSILNVNQLKVYSDGIVSGATAALIEPYLDNLGLPFDKGLNYFDETRLTKYITQLEKVGFDFLIHVIGDRGTREALNSIEKARMANPTLTPRHRLTHLEIVNSEDIKRFKRLDVIADVQVAGEFTNPKNWDLDFGPLIGKERSKNIIPLKDLNNAGARITLSSDYDVSDINPFIGMSNALTRAPQNLETVAQAVKAYTINSAYCMRNEDITGSITVWKYADLIIVDRDIFSIPVADISKTMVHATIFEGKVVYTDKSIEIPDAVFTSTYFGNFGLTFMFGILLLTLS